MKTKLAILTLLLLAVTGCSDWERVTFQSLAASQAVIKQAQVDYEARTIPRTPAAFAAINQAKTLQTNAVEAMVVYENIKASKGTVAALDAQQQVVGGIVNELPPLIASIQLLYTASKATTGGKP
jgi:hypothetical protein